MTLIASKSDQVGILYHEITCGSVNKNRFSEFMKNLCVILGEERACFIMDYAPVHNEIEGTIDVPVRKLPPYSPFLNPIEDVFQRSRRMLNRDWDRSRGPWMIVEKLK